MWSRCSDPVPAGPVPLSLSRFRSECESPQIRGSPKSECPQIREAPNPRIPSPRILGRGRGGFRGSGGAGTLGRELGGAQGPPEWVWGRRDPREGRIRGSKDPSPDGTPEHPGIWVGGPTNAPLPKAPRGGGGEVGEGEGEGPRGRSRSPGQVTPQVATATPRARHGRLRPLHPGPQGQAADQPELQGRCGSGGDGQLHGGPAAAGGGGDPHPRAEPRRRALPVDQTRQPLLRGHHQEERQRLLGVLLPLQGGGGVLRVFQGAGGGKHPRQLRRHLRAAGRADGLRLPPDHGQQDPAGVHHAGGEQAGDGQVARAHHGDQRRVLALRGNSLQEERGVHRRHRGRQPAGERERQRGAQRGAGLHQAQGFPVGNARAAPGPQRPRAVRADGPGEEQVGGAGGRQVPPVRPSVPLRQRPHHLLHPPRRRLRAHVLPPAHPGEAAHLDRIHHREILPQPPGNPGQGQGPVQEAIGGQRRGDLGARAQRRRLAQIQNHAGLGSLRPRAQRAHLEHQILPGGQGAPDARPLWLAQRGEGGGGGAAAYRCALRDPLLHRVRHPGEVHEDHREERVPGAALGALHHPERGLPDPHHLRGSPMDPQTPHGPPGATPSSAPIKMELSPPPTVPLLWGEWKQSGEGSCLNLGVSGVRGDVGRGKIEGFGG